ncbi:MAG TPA: membrane protein insertase YidC [Hyphomonadaceae bacterium]|jgi:YidC/Oxa1 family membrane protein insertase|nr:membrane protein insertase YidC [Hyphomonadaceae bacterium]
MEPAEQRNILLALVLFAVMMVAYEFLFAAPARDRAKAAQPRTTTAQQPTSGQTNAPLTFQLRDDIVKADIAAGKRVLVEGPALDGSISLEGARIDDISLKGFYDTIDAKLKQDRTQEVQLLSPLGTDRPFYAVVAWTSEGGFSTNDATWTQTNQGQLTPENPLHLTYTGAAARIDRIITIDANYMFTVSDTLTNTGSSPVTLTPMVEMRQRALASHMVADRLEQGAFRGVVGTYGSEKNQMRGYSDLAKSDTDKSKGVLTEVSGGWIALTTKYWMAAAIPPQGEPVTMRAGVAKANGQSVFNAGFSASAYTVQPGQSVTKSSRVFAGAKRVAVLDNYEHDTSAPVPSFSDAVDWSWLFFITKPFFYLLQTFSGWFGSFAAAILALTVVVKTVFYPLLYLSSKSMAKMRKVQPEMKILQERFAADPQRMRLEQANLFKREKVNPAAGCLPMLPTVFVFWALYHTLIVTLEMRHTPFFGTWIQDMSAVDPVSIFNGFGLLQQDGHPMNLSHIPVIGGFLMVGPWALLYGCTMVALQSLSAPPTDPMQKQIMRFLPLVFMILFGGFAAGLVIYYVWSNFITVIQQYLVMRHTGVETEIDKFLKKRFGKKPPTDGPAANVAS